MGTLIPTIKIEGKTYPIDEQGFVVVKGKKFVVLDNSVDWKTTWRKIRKERGEL